MIAEKDAFHFFWLITNDNVMIKAVSYSSSSRDIFIVFNDHHVLWTSDSLRAASFCFVFIDDQTNKKSSFFFHK